MIKSKGLTENEIMELKVPELQKRLKNMNVKMKRNLIKSELQELLKSAFQNPNYDQNHDPNKNKLKQAKGVADENKLIQQKSLSNKKYYEKTIEKCNQINLIPATQQNNVIDNSNYQITDKDQYLSEFNAQENGPIHDQDWCKSEIKNFYSRIIHCSSVQTSS